MSRTRFASIAAALVFALPAAADVKPHAIFGDHMVLQRNVPLPVWGTAEPGEEVYVFLEIKTADGKREEGQSAKADKDGKWTVKFAPFPAGTEGTLTIRGAERKREPKGKEKPNAVAFKDVAVGEVWVASGQSNMEWTLGGSMARGNGAEVIKNSTNPNLRVFTVSKYAIGTPQAGFNPKPQSPRHDKWLPSNPENAGMFTAVGYYFGRDLQKALNVPIGIIHTSWGGTPAQSWTSREALEADPVVKHYIEDLDKRKKGWDPNKARMQFEEAIAKWTANVEEAKKNNKPAPPRPNPQQEPGTSAWDGSSLYNGMISPLLPFPIKGAIWYQGESNAGQPIEYQSLYADMIRDWRKRWGSDFSFYCVQLAPWNPGDPAADNWAYLREAQAIASKNVKHAGVAVITDAGHKTDIHPQRKEPAGARLALLALAHDYGRKIEHHGPTYKELKVDGNKAVVTFDHVAGGLTVEDVKMEDNTAAPSVKLVGFEVAGEDKKFHPATATIEGDTVVVTSPEVSKPVAVRYGWRNLPICNLANKAGLPASPFRTDDWTPPGLK
jgi:sialate O-acetylesterase